MAKSGEYWTEDHPGKAMMMDPSALTEQRRQDRAVNEDAWIEDMLARTPVGTFSTSLEGQPFLHTVLFVYDRDRRAIYFHTALTGRTRLNLEQNPRVCFGVSELGRLLPAASACEMSVEFASVIVFGRAEIIEDDTEALYGLQLLVNKYYPHLRAGRDYRPTAPVELRRASVYRVHVEAWSGKRKLGAEDDPGAFTYPARGGKA